MKLTYYKTKCLIILSSHERYLIVLPRRYLERLYFFKCLYSNSPYKRTNIITIIIISIFITITFLLLHFIL